MSGRRPHSMSFRKLPHSQRGWDRQHHSGTNHLIRLCTMPREASASCMGASRMAVLSAGSMSPAGVRRTSTQPPPSSATAAPSNGDSRANRYLRMRACLQLLTKCSLHFFVGAHIDIFGFRQRAAHVLERSEESIQRCTGPKQAGLQEAREAHCARAGVNCIDAERGRCRRIPAAVRQPRSSRPRLSECTASATGYSTRPASHTPRPLLFDACSADSINEISGNPVARDSSGLDKSSAPEVSVSAGRREAANQSSSAAPPGRARASASRLAVPTSALKCSWSPITSLAPARGQSAPSETLTRVQPSVRQTMRPVAAACHARLGLPLDFHNISLPAWEWLPLSASESLGPCVMKRS